MGGRAERFRGIESHEFVFAVVKLFNAIRTQQKVTDVAVSRAADASSTSRAIEKAKNGMHTSIQ
jgi:Flp pilus assembly protein TadG